MHANPQRPTGPPRDPALDGLRGFAILLVFLFHYGGGLRAHNPLVRALGYLTQAGWMGVNLFFALSGFLITNLLADALYASPRPSPPRTPGSVPQPHRIRHRLRSFYARRALRILPLYYAALLACAAAALLTGAHLTQLKPLALYAAFLQNIPPLVNPALHTPPPLPVFHLWSLAVEEQFYLLWPLLLLAARTPRRALHLSLWTFGLTTLFRALLFNPHVLSPPSAQTLATFLPTRAGALVLGAALALYRFQRSSDSQRPLSSSGIAQEYVASAETAQPRSGAPHNPSATAQDSSLSATATNLTATLALTLLLLAFLHTHTFLLNTPSAYALTLPAADLLAVTLVALSLQPNLLRRAFSQPALRFLGRISYGFYVLHILLEPLFDRLGTLLTHAHAGFAYQTARLLTAFLLTTAAAWLSFTLLESPFLRLKRRFPRAANVKDHA